MISPALDMTDAHVSIKGVLWKNQTPQASLVQQLCQYTEISTFLSHLVSNRVQDVQEGCAFLSPKLSEHLPSPFVLPDINKAIARIIDALKHQEKIALWGDYDVDGGTSVALWSRFLKVFGADIRPYIPDRFQEGYGINKEGLDRLKNEGVSLVITLDCGTNATDTLAHAKHLGLDVIVVDHHDAKDGLPPAYAIVNPKRQDASTACHDLSILAAVGVSFLCLVALRAHLKKEDMFSQKANVDLRSFLDLVALGTVCDVVPLKGINRLLTHKGLEIINKTPAPGIVALLEAANVQEPITTYHLGFVLGPRLNAGGRMAASNLACRLLSKQSLEDARALAEQLSHLNRERQAIERHVTDEAGKQAQEQAHNPFLIVYSEDWHEGVIGIVASRLKERYKKPTFVITFDTHGHGKGSGRSVPGVSLGTLIHKAADSNLILQGGGHDMAGGISLRRDQIKSFQDFCNKTLAQNPPNVRSTRYFDTCLHFQSLTQELFAEISQLEPFGAHNPKPLFLFEYVQIAFKRPLKRDHLYFELTQQDGTTASALLFNSSQTSFYPYVENKKLGPFHLIASLSFDTWRQKVTLAMEDIILLS